MPAAPPNNEPAARPTPGFTLMELVIVLTIAAVLVAWSFPSLIQSIHNNQVASQNVALVALLNFAKSEAIRRNTPVTIVFDAHAGGWDAFVEDPNNEVEVEGCVPGQLRCTSNMGALLTIGTTELTFNNRGYIRGAEDAWEPETVFLQHESCSGQNQRQRIDLTPTGQISGCRLPCNSFAACPP